MNVLRRYVKWFSVRKQTFLLTPHAAELESEHPYPFLHFFPSLQQRFHSFLRNTVKTLKIFPQVD